MGLLKFLTILYILLKALPWLRLRRKTLEASLYLSLCIPRLHPYIYIYIHMFMMLVNDTSQIPNNRQALLPVGETFSARFVVQPLLYLWVLPSVSRSVFFLLHIYKCIQTLAFIPPTYAAPCGKFSKRFFVRAGFRCEMNEQTPDPNWTLSKTLL